MTDTGSDYRWYVDPLDGTTNFAHGFPVFCVSLAVEHKGHRIAGVVYDPTRDEMFSAEQGSGAFLNQQPIHVSDDRQACRISGGDRLSQQQAAQKSEYSLLSPDYVAHAWGAARRLGCARSLLRGLRAAGSLLGIQLKPWDTAAGVLMVEEAGGKITNFAGGALQYRQPRGVVFEWLDPRSVDPRISADFCWPRAGAHGRSASAIKNRRRLSSGPLSPKNGRKPPFAPPKRHFIVFSAASGADWRYSIRSSCILVKMRFCRVLPN